MSSANILPLRDSVYLFADAASYDLDGVLISIQGKINIVPSLSAAMIFTGRSIVSPYVIDLLDQEANDFDELIEIMPARLPGMMESLTDLFGADQHDEAQGQSQGFRAFVGGWSERRGKPVAFSISSVEDAAGRPAFTVHEAPGGFQSPGVSDEQCRLGFGGPPKVTPENIEDVARTMLELQRQVPFASGHFSVGGFAELVTVRRDNISTKVLHRWKEDVVGRPITPAPVDWSAWRARRIAGSAPIPGLSRQERRAMESKARKSSLRVCRP